jgi:hypothetical protein
VENVSLDSDLYSEGLVLISSGLLSKWGFCDGDVLDDDLYEELEEIGFWEADLRSVRDPAVAFSLGHRALIRLVREYLVPRLDQDVEVVEIGSSCNPIRASKVDGVDVEGCWYGNQPDPHLTPESVVVSTVDVLRVCRHVMESAGDTPLT